MMIDIGTKKGDLTRVCPKKMDVDTNCIEGILVWFYSTELINLLRNRFHRDKKLSGFTKNYFSIP